jgi:oxygen-dependent protoporphyrinogen oxidase
MYKTGMSSRVDTKDEQAPVFVVGAGPSGLTAAHRLRREGRRPILFDARDRVGGQVHTHREAGYLMEEGATILPSAYQAVLDVVEEVGMTHALVPAGSRIGFARGSEIHELRSDHLFLDAARSRLIGARSKLAMAPLGVVNARIGRHLNYEDLSSVAAWDTETPRDFCRRHLGMSGEVYDYVIDATVRGVLGVRSDTISVAELFFMINNILGTKLYAFRNGYSEYVEALAAGQETRLGCTVHELTETADGVRISYTDAGGVARTEDGAGAVVTARGDRLPDLLPGYFADPECERFLRALRYTKCVVMNTGVTRAPAGIKASVTNVPEDIDPGVMGFTCEHNKAPGRAPEGKGLLCFLSMTEDAERLIGEDDDTVRAWFLRGAEKILPGVSDTVDYTRISRWEEVIVYSRPGLYRELGDFQKRRPRGTRIQLGGIFWSSSNICTATTSGERAVRELLPALAAGTPASTLAGAA